MLTIANDYFVKIQKYFSTLSERNPISVSAFLFIFGTTGNVIIIIIITCNKDMRTIPNMYILNLAISDTFYLTTFLLETLLFKYLPALPGNEIVCTFYAFWGVMSVGLTAYSVAVLSIQRYRVTVNPLHVHVCSQPTWRGTGTIICGVWIVAALFAIPAAPLGHLCVNPYMILNTNYCYLLTIFKMLV
jgi:hypothetical protein